MYQRKKFLQTFEYFRLRIRVNFIYKGDGIFVVIFQLHISHRGCPARDIVDRSRRMHYKYMFPWILFDDGIISRRNVGVLRIRILIRSFFSRNGTRSILLRASRT